MDSRLSMRPTGWFQAGWSADVLPGRTASWRYLGQEMVAFRGRDGALHVLDAHCKHLGANLSEGGCVVDGGIQCPFHGWVWDGDGANVSIPYQDRPNRSRRMRSYPVVERNEVVFLWYDEQGRAPLWEVPDILDLGRRLDPEATYHRVGTDGQQLFERVRVHPQFVIENAVDAHHFQFVHRTPISPTPVTSQPDEWSWEWTLGFGRSWADGTRAAEDRMGTITIHFSGVGLGFNSFLQPDGISLVLIATTPVDDEVSNVFGTYWFSRTADDERLPANFAQRLAVAKRALPDDVKIWHHQRYTEPPALATSEAAGFRELRRWTRRFYPEGAGPSTKSA